MLFNRSQLLLAGIPTGAALIGLLWLKRRHSSQSLHHTDPGGSPSPEKKEINKELEENKHKEENNCEIEEDNLEKLSFYENITKNFIEICDRKNQQELELTEEEEINGQHDDNFREAILLKKTDEVNKLFEESTETLNKKEETNLLHNSTEELFQIEIDDRASEENIAFQEVTTTEVEIEKVTTKSTALPVEAQKNTIKSEAEIYKPVKVSKTVEQVVVGTTQKDKEEESEKVVLSSATPTVELVKKEEETVIEEVEGAVGIMKTGPTQLAEKLASLELDTVKIRDESVETEQKGCSERDSANHSPSEVMLASPSISNFSDAHSEGSSDSGKGHSDVATSPAGGSSLAGDLAPSIYEFVLPQVIVGRLIGRRGTFLHEIRSSTQTNIYIKRHPDTDKLKICAIEGSQSDIEKALAKIRQKFPLRRFPQLTLEKVSFVTLNQLPPLKLEDFNLQLVEGVNNDVILSSLITAAHFFLQQPSHPSYGSLGALNQVMNQIYSTSEAPILETPFKDAVCAAPTMGGWYRAQIVNLEEDTGNCTVRFLDYGGYLTLESSSLRQIRGDLLALPFQAVECYLANVATAGEDGWTEEARLFVHNATVGQVLQAQIYDYAEDGRPLVYLYASFGSQVVLINEELVMRGYAVLTSSQEE